MRPTIFPYLFIKTTRYYQLFVPLYWANGSSLLREYRHL